MSERWEYHWHTGALKQEKQPGRQFLEDLNLLGQQGWEAVSMHGDILVGTVLLKRRLPDE